MSLEGEAQSRVLRKQIESYGDPRLYALSIVSKQLAAAASHLSPNRCS